MAAHQSSGELKMTDKSNFRAEKNEQIAAKEKARAEDQAKEKDVKSELDEKTHWRFKKNQGINHGTTTMADIDKSNKPAKKTGKKPSKEEIAKSNKSTSPEAEVPKKDRIWSNEGAEELTRKEQDILLKSRGVSISYKDKEKDIIKKIIKSNPKV